MSEPTTPKRLTISTSLGEAHQRALLKITQINDETAAACLRRLVREEAMRLGIWVSEVEETE